MHRTAYFAIKFNVNFTRLPLKRENDVTVIVGILCQDGVAIASDRQITATAVVPLSQPPTLQTSIAATTKIAVIENDVLLGVSGTPTIGDEYEVVIRKNYSRFKGGLYENATRAVQREIREIINEHIKTAISLVPLVGQLVAYSQAEGLCLCFR